MVFPLFQTVEDSYVVPGNRQEAGDVYNDFDGSQDKLMKDSDLEDDEVESSENGEEESTTVELQEPTVTQNDIDGYFLQSDEAKPERWKKDHPLFSCSNDILYKKKIETLLKLSSTDWKKLPIMAADVER